MHRAKRIVVPAVWIASLCFGSAIPSANAQPSQCTGTGDMNGDGSIDGDDIGSFVTCLIEQSPTCFSGDFDQDGLVTPLDVPPFTDRLMSGMPALSLPGAAWLMTMPAPATGERAATRMDFLDFPIPPNFFGPGSDPFAGIISFVGQPLDAAQMGTTDTLAAHGVPQFPPGFPSTAPAVCVELRGLNLLSDVPVEITADNGQSSALWNVRLQMSGSTVPNGSLTATRLHANGGTADVVVSFLPVLIFTLVDDPSIEIRLDFSALQLPAMVLVANGVPWVHTATFASGVMAPADAALLLGVEEDPPSGQQTLRTIVMSTPGGVPTMTQAVQPAYNPNPTGYMSVTEVSDMLECPSTMPRNHEVSATWIAPRCGIASIQIVNTETDDILGFVDCGCAPAASLTIMVDLKDTDLIRTVVETCGPHADRDCCTPFIDDIQCGTINGATFLSMGDSSGESRTLTSPGAPASSLWTRTRAGEGNVAPLDFNGAAYPLTATQTSSAVNDIIIDRSSYDDDGDWSLSQSRLTVARFRLAHVTFGGDFFNILSRDEDGMPYRPPHWRDENGDGDASDVGEPHVPLCYTRSEFMTVTHMAFTAQPAGLPPCDLRIAGVGTDESRFSGVADSVGNEWQMNAPMPADQRLHWSVQYVNPYRIQWSASFADAAFGAAGESDNRLYTTMRIPTLATLHESVVHLACHNSSGLITDDAVTDSIWQGFRDRDVRRKPIDGFNNPDGIRMGFWRSRTRISYFMASMLANPYGDGTCGAWAELLNACFRVHGMSFNQFVEILPNRTLYPQADGILVNNWTFQHNINAGANGINNSFVLGDDIQVIPRGRGLPYSTAILAGDNNVLDSIPGGDDVAVDGEINCGPDGVCNTVGAGDDWVFALPGAGKPGTAAILAGPNGLLESLPNVDDLRITLDPLDSEFPYFVDVNVVNLLGCPGQDNVEPPEVFSNHIVTRHNGRIYDPSYGLGPFDTQNEHENAILSAIRSTPYARPNDPDIAELEYTDQ